MDVHNPKELPVPEDMLIEAHETDGLVGRKPFFHWSRGIFVLVIILFLGILLFGSYVFLIGKRQPIEQKAVLLTKSTTSAEKWKSYESKKYDFTISYPSTLTYEETDGSDAPTNFYKNVPIVSFSKGVTIKVFDAQRVSESQVIHSYYTAFNPKTTSIPIGSYSGTLYSALGTGSSQGALIATLVHQQKIFYFQLTPLNKSSISKEEFFHMLSTFTVIDPGIDTSTWQQFTDPNYGFSFKYPQDWQLDVGGKFPDTSWTFPLPKLNELITTSTWTNPRYTIDFAIPNPAFPQDKLGIGIELLNNEQNITLDRFLDEYLGDGKSTWRITHLTLNGFPAVEISGPDDPTTKDSNVNSQVYIFVPSPDKKTSYVYNLRFMLNGEGTSKVYTTNDPFVQKELPLFNGFVNSFTK